jgi:hypothetical protein
MGQIMSGEFKQQVERLVRRQQYRQWMTALRPVINKVILICSLLITVLAIAYFVYYSFPPSYPVLIISLCTLLFVSWQAISLHPSREQACAQLDHILNAQNLLISSREINLRGEKTMVDKLILQRAQQKLPHWKLCFQAHSGMNLQPNLFALSLLVLSLVTLFLSAPPATTESLTAEIKNRTIEADAPTRHTQKFRDLLRRAATQSAFSVPTESGVSTSRTRLATENYLSDEGEQMVDKVTKEAREKSLGKRIDTLQISNNSLPKKIPNTSSNKTTSRNTNSAQAKSLKISNQVNLQLEVDSSKNALAFDSSLAARTTTSSLKKHTEQRSTKFNNSIQPTYSGTSLSIEQRLRVAAYFKLLENTPSQ